MIQPGSGPIPFHLPVDLWMEMLAHILNCLPQEACGLVGSRQRSSSGKDAAESLRTAALPPSLADPPNAVDPPNAAVPPAAEDPPNAAVPLVAAVVLPIENELHSPYRFKMAPAEQLKAFYWLEDNQMELSAIFHSHPQGPDHPSETDLAEFAYPGVLMLIVSPLDLAASPPAVLSAAGAVDRWQVRAFRIDGGFASGLAASEVPLVHVPRSQRSAG